MNNENTKKTKNTFFHQKKVAITEFWNKAIAITTWNKIIMWWGYLWAWYYLTYMFIAPLLKNVFLIATWSNLIIFYGIIIFISFILSHIINTLMKILLYIFKS